MIEPKPSLTFSEFVDWEISQDDLHELINGQIVPFQAESNDHELITGNVFAKLHAAVEPPCAVFPSTTIVQTTTRREKDGYRPDVTVSCSPHNIGSKNYVVEPRIVVEVVSPSNKGKSWNLKLFESFNTESIEHLVLIGGTRRETTSHLRGPDGRWLPAISQDNDGELEFPTLGFIMTFSQIYRGTSLASS